MNLLKHGSAASASLPQRRIVVRSSGVHGRGVFATRLIPEGERIIEYKGERIDWDEALRRHPHDPSQPDHTFYFSVDEGLVIDGNVAGNAARWINHACVPNCEAGLYEVRGQLRVFIEALRTIQPGEELFFDYSLVLEERHTAKVKARYTCRCGHKLCRGTMLAPKKRRRNRPENE